LNTKSKIFLYLSLSFVGGIFLGSLLNIPTILFWLGLVIGILLISVWRHSKKIVVVGFCLLVFLGGMYRLQLASTLNSNTLQLYNDKEEVVLQGTVVKEPDIRTNKIKLTLTTKFICSYAPVRRNNKDCRKIEGKVLVTVPRYPEYKYSDELEIQGKLKTPVEFEDFNYREYLEKVGIYSVMYWPEKVTLMGKAKGWKYLVYGKILAFKDRLRQSIGRSLSPPQGSILSAMMLGDKQKLSENLKEQLNITGTRHIVAISGMHISIISLALMYLLIYLGFWRRQAFWLVLIFISLYIIMIGMPASAVRGGVMGLILAWAQIEGRLRGAARAIIFAAVPMLLVNPLLLRFDVGFQLSFAAVLGIIWFKPFFDGWFERLPNILRARDILAMTFSAQIATLPILIYNFGRISLVSPLVNVLIVPLLPYILGGGFIFGFLGMAWLPLGQILSWPVWLLLTYLSKIIDFFSSLPYAAITAKNVHWLWLIGYYIVLVAVLVWWRNKKRKLLRSSLQ